MARDPVLPVFLFLDRDGVINRRLPGDYVRCWSDFRFLEGVLEALADLSRKAERIFIVTNQQGIGKGLMTEEDLQAVHQPMLQAIARAGGRIDGLYYCPHLASEGCSCRKPGPGMVLQAKHAFPEVDFHRSVMVGDSLSDMQMGDRMGMHNVLIQTKMEEQEVIERAMREEGLSVPYRFSSLLELAEHWQELVL